MVDRRVGLAVTALAVVVALAGGVAAAARRAPSREAERISTAGHSLKWSWIPPGRSDRYGHAETLVHAPLNVVRSRVLEFARYRDFMPDKFKTSRVVGHHPDGSSDVYMQVLVMNGMVTLWDVTRFAPPRSVAPGVDEIEGRMVPGKGNVEDVDAIWTMSALDAAWTLLEFDLLLKPGLPAPQSAVDEELRDSALCAVDAIHDRAQGSPGIVKWSR